MQSTTLNKPFNKVFETCKEVLQELGIRINNANSSTGIINASTSSSIFSWGEEIEIKIKHSAKDHTNISVESVSSAQLISWGKNSTNENSIITLLKQKLHK